MLRYRPSSRAIVYGPWRTMHLRTAAACGQLFDLLRGSPLRRAASRGLGRSSPPPATTGRAGCPAIASLGPIPSRIRITAPPPTPRAPQRPLRDHHRQPRPAHPPVRHPAVPGSCIWPKGLAPGRRFRCGQAQLALMSERPGGSPVAVDAPRGVSGEAHGGPSGDGHTFASLFRRRATVRPASPEAEEHPVLGPGLQPETPP